MHKINKTGGVFLLLSKISFYGTTLILIVLILVLSLKFNKKTENKIIEEVSNEYIASYFDGEYQNEIPGKDDGYVVDKIVCDNGATATWNTEEWGINIRNATQKIKCSIYFLKYYEFNYTGTEQAFTVPKTGTYKIELWGAGAGLTPSDTVKTLSFGSYTSGNIKLSSGTILYIYVGENGYGFAEAYSNKRYRYNGGGYGNYVCFEDNSTYGNGNYGYNYAGGGATDVRLVNGNWNDFNSLKSRIIVAAGAGGTNNLDRYSPSNGGGLYSENGGYYGSAEYMATGATQISSGSANASFGIGGYATYGGNSCNFSDGGGGGGGYYGGGGAKTGNQVYQAATGAGGSSFISGHNGCDAIKEESTEGNIIHTGQSIHYSGMYFKDTVMIDGDGYKWTTEKGSYTGMPTHDGSKVMKGNTGNGYVKITYIG